MKCRTTQQGYTGFIILGLIASILITWAWLGSRKDSNMSELDKINLSLNVAASYDCYFDDIKVTRNAQNNISQVSIQQDGKTYLATEVALPEFKNQVYRIDPAQIMYCTEGTYNFKTPYLIISYSLSELSEQKRIEKMQAIRKDRLFKKIEKQNSYFSF